jgi:glycosyl transferase family 25
VEVVKLEKFGEGASTVLLGPSIGTTPGTGRALHHLYSRHVGGAAYILSRHAAEEGLKLRGQLRVPVDHLLFNATVSALSRRLRPVVVRPAMATQRRYGYNSDVAALGKAVRPKGWRRRWRSLKRGMFEVRLLPQQAFLYATGQARLLPLTWEEREAGSSQVAADESQ